MDINTNFISQTPEFFSLSMDIATIPYGMLGHSSGYFRDWHIVL